MQVIYYSHTQEVKGKWPLAAAIAGGAAIFALTPAGLIGRLVLLGTFGAIGATFKSLTINLDAESLNLQFGKSPVKKSFLLSSIKSAKPIRTTPMQGWGIHWAGSGWLYNVYGLDAVEVELNDGKCVFLGTDEPQELAAVINQHCHNG